MRVVHILKHGLPLCPEGPPESWPTAHRWVSIDDYPNERGQHSFCYVCVHVFDNQPETMELRTSCPKCNGDIRLEIEEKGFISATVRCKGCDSSVGVHANGAPHLVYDPGDPPF